MAFLVVPLVMQQAHAQEYVRHIFLPDLSGNKWISKSSSSSCCWCSHGNNGRDSCKKKWLKGLIILCGYTFLDFISTIHTLLPLLPYTVYLILNIHLDA